MVQKAIIYTKKIEDSYLKVIYLFINTYLIVPRLILVLINKLLFIFHVISPTF